MKKFIIATTALCMIVSVASAQGLHFGPRLGMSVSNFIHFSESSDIQTQSKLGVHVGATAEFEILSFLYVSTTLSLYQKGNKNEYPLGTSKSTFSFLDLPIEIGYKMPIGNISVFGQVGPFVSVAVAGRGRWIPDESYSDETSSYSLYEYDNYKRFDTGVGLAAGIDYKNYQVRFSYSFGFINIEGHSSYSAQTSAFSVTGAYFIGRNY